MSENAPALIPLHARDGSVRAYAVVDPQDHEWLSQWPWHLNDKGYAKRGSARPIYMHRVILGLEAGDGREGDHANRNRLDNRRANLRIVTRSENRQNRGPNANTTSQYRGVSWNRNARKWRAYVRIDGRLTYLGSFDDEHTAGRAAAEARQRLLPLSTEEAA